MKFLRISTPYPHYLKQFYAERPGLARRSFEEQGQALLNDSFQQVDSYAFYMTALGYECEEIIANAAPMQKAWCRAHRVQWPPEDFDWHVTLARAKRFQPEVVLLANARRFSKPWIDELRACCPRLRCVLGWWGVDIPSAEPLRGLDTVLTCNQELATRMRSMGVRVAVLPFAFDPRILERIDASRAPSIAVSFVGSVRRRDGFHARRAHLLECISERFPLSVCTQHREPPRWAIVAGRLAFELCRGLRRARLGERWLRQIPVMSRVARWKICPQSNGHHRLWKTVAAPVYGLRYYQTLRDSSVSLNVHPECAGMAASTLRLFEASGIGSCLLTDWKSDLPEFFEPEQEVVTFRTEAECLEKLGWLLAHEPERSAIARAGQQRTLQHHHFFGLAQRLHEIIRKSI